MLRLRSIESPSQEECLAQIERLTASPLFEGSEAHCRLIKFLGERALNSPAEKLKEYQVATEGLGRSPDFDPHSDSSVRVQVGRLRNKLTEYYNSVGAEDPILIEIPKGRYRLSFKKRFSPTQEDLSGQPIENVLTPLLTKPRLKWSLGKPAIAVAIFLAFILLIVAAAIPFFRANGVARSLPLSVNAKAPATPLEVFWAPFIQAPEEPFVVFKVIDFVGNPAKGMRRFDPSRDKKANLIQDYTGVGEVMGVLELNQLFARYGHSFHVKRSALFTLDDAQDYNVIFVGSPGAQLSQIRSTRRFTLKRAPDGFGSTKLVVMSTDPGSSKSTVEAVSSGGQPNGVDYAIVALEKAPDNPHWKLFLEGTSTVATQAAVDFVCSESSVGILENRLHVTNATSPKPFEGLLKLTVSNDVPMDTELVDLHEVNN